jgi:hypothetical protein
VTAVRVQVATQHAWLGSRLQQHASRPRRRNSTQVPRSFQSTMRLRVSAPITSARRTVLLPRIMASAVAKA